MHIQNLCVCVCACVCVCVHVCVCVCVCLCVGGGVDKVKWIEEERKEMEEGVKHHRYGNFFRRMRKLATPAVLLL